MAVDVRSVVQWMESWAPTSFAEEGDKVGLQIGSMRSPVHRVAVALDVTEAVADEAIERGASLIIAHHPIIFRPLAALRTDRPDGRLIAKLVKHDISVYASHTNLDVAVGGVNDLLAQALGLTATRPLKTSVSETLYKLVTYVPPSHVDAVRDAVFAAGAGRIGKYSHCGFTSGGTGTFLPGEGAQPFLGEPGKLESASEQRFETVVPESRKAAAVKALLAAHPYEEVAYDVFRLELEGAAYGLGRVGTLEAPMTLQAFAESAKAAFGVPALRIAGDPSRTVKKVAVLGGSGRSYVKHAIAAGADVFVTGDLDHHTAHDAIAAGLALVDPGHHIEQIMKAAVAGRLNEHASKAGWEIEAFASTGSTEPFVFL